MQSKKHIRKRFLVADDHSIVRLGLNTVLRGIHPKASIDESVDGSDIIEKLTLHTYDLIIMDILMSKSETIGLIKHIHTFYPAIPVLLYSMSAESIYGIGCLKAGAKGFVSKVAPIDELITAINLVMLGKTYLSQSFLELLSSQQLKSSETAFSNLIP